MPPNPPINPSAQPFKKKRTILLWKTQNLPDARQRASPTPAPEVVKARKRRLKRRPRVKRKNLLSKDFLVRDADAAPVFIHLVQTLPDRFLCKGFKTQFLIKTFYTLVVVKEQDFHF